DHLRDQHPLTYSGRRALTRQFSRHAECTGGNRNIHRAVHQDLTSLIIYVIRSPMCSVCEPFQKPGLNFLYTLSIELLAAAYNNRTGRACDLRIVRGDMGSQGLICVMERLACLDSQSQSFVFRGEIPENIMPGHPSVAITWLVPVQLFQQGRQLLAQGSTKYVEVDFQFTILGSDLLQHHCGD